MPVKWCLKHLLLLLATGPSVAAAAPFESGEIIMGCLWSLFPGADSLMLQPPFVAVDKSGDVYIYSSPSEITRDLEPIDVENGEYRLYDSKGAIAGLIVQRALVRDAPWILGGKVWRETVSIEESSQPLAPEDLCIALNKALDFQPNPPQERPANLLELILLAADVLGYSP